MKKDFSVGFIGGGRITQIFLAALKRKDKWPSRVAVTDRNPAVLDRIASQFPRGACLPDKNREAAASDLVFLALHPTAIGHVLAEIRGGLSPQCLFISLAPKVTIDSLSAGLGGFDRIVRMIPNAPSIINRGYNPLAFSSSFEKDERKDVAKFLKVFGDCPEVEEDKLEAYAILTAMGPTYFFFQLHELQKLGISFGLTEKEARKGLSKMMKGTLKTLFEGGLSYSEVTDLIPVKPIGDEEGRLRDLYREKLEGLYRNLKG